MTEKGKGIADVGKSIASSLSSFHMEADRYGGGMALVLSGIIGISDFSDSFIHLLSHSCRINVKGSALFIRVYESGRVEIVGHIEGIVFSYGKK